MSAIPLLEVRSLSKHFGGLRALDGVDLQVQQGEIVGVIGPNGAGKTTLFNIITGVLRPSSGTVALNGTDISSLPPEKICRLGIARTYQKVRPFARLTALENVLVSVVNRPTGVGSMAHARTLARDLLERVGLGPYAGIETSRLNLFHRKKVELARALGAGAQLLLLDEVMAGLTHVESDAAVALLRTLKQEFRFTIVCIEHLMRIIMSLSDRIVVLDHGKVIASGTPSEVVANIEVQKAYLGSEHA